MNMTNPRPILALCGPSGVGKEYIKDLINESRPCGRVGHYAAKS